MEHKNEKLMNVFWLRQAFHQIDSLATRWRSLIKRSSSNTFITSLTIFFFFILALVLMFAGWIDLAYYSDQFFQIRLRNSSRVPITIEYPLNCTSWNQTNTCPKNYPTTFEPFSSSNPTTCPEYLRWIHEDLRHWKKTGITRNMVEKASETAHFRLVILDGKIYVENYKPSFQTRSLFTMWGIVQLLRFYPGKLPDLELMFDCDDMPVVIASDYKGFNATPPPPLFKYSSDELSLDIVFPDWSFWGWGETNIKPWRILLKDIKEGNKKTKWEDRVPYAYWRGNPYVASWRVELMKCNLTDKDNWNTLLYIQDWNEESKKGFTQSNLEDQCTHRYKIYIEGRAWSVSGKYILACDSPTLLISPRYYDFFIRGMVPLKHYWPIDDNDKCKSLKFAVEWGNNHTEKAKAIGEAGSQFIQEDMKMEYIYDYMFHLLNEYSKLLKFKPKIPKNATQLCSESMACSTNGIWRKFMELSLEKSPSNSQPCSMPPPYDPSSLKAFVDEKDKSTKEVEGWVNKYWEKNIKKE